MLEKGKARSISTEATAGRCKPASFGSLSCDDVIPLLVAKSKQVCHSHAAIKIFDID